LLTDEATSYTDNGAYGSFTTLAKVDPAYAADLNNGTITVKHAATGASPDWACLYETSASGTLYGVGIVSTTTPGGGPLAGTYYWESASGTAPGCTGAFGTGWHTNATAAGW